MQLHLASTHSPKMKVTRRNQLIRRGSKTMKNDNMFSNELRTAKIRDLHLHPTPWHVLCWGTTLTESAVHSLVHPCCASVKSGSNPTELRRFVTGANCGGVERRSRAPRHRDELRDDCHKATAQLTSATDGNSSSFLTTTVVQVGCRLQVLGIIIWEEHFEWSICQTLFKSQSWNET